jgi:hypothetical protein
VRPTILIAVIALAAHGAVVAPAAPDGGSITKPQATALIHEVNLQPGDLRGSAPFVGEAGTPATGAGLQRGFRCGHRGKARGRAVAGEASALLIARYNESVASVVVVMPSDALAAAEVAALPSRAGRSCLARALREGTVGSRAKGLYAAKVTFVPVARLLGPGAVALHVLATLRDPRDERYRLGPGGKVLHRPKLLYSFEAIFRVGAADIIFAVLSERRRFPVANENHLLSLLYSRAQAHKL